MAAYVDSSRERRSAVWAADRDLIANYVSGSITIDPHPLELQGNDCTRCEIPVNDELHVPGENAEERRTKMKAAELIAKLAVILGDEGNERFSSWFGCVGGQGM
jgi:hypothetical protein